MPKIKINCSMLEAVDYEYKGKRDIDIEIIQPEFTSLCPRTGLPDFGTITIHYTPDEKIVELKSIKLYLLQYRNFGIFYEHLANKILDDLVALVKPKKMEIIADFTPRGGILTTIRAEYNRS